jgi:hypothetical protein
MLSIKNEAGGDIGQGQGKGAKFPTRTCEGYDAGDGTAWGGERRRAAGAAHYKRLCSADLRDRSKDKNGRRVERNAPRSLGGSFRIEARPRAVEEERRRATGAAHYQRWCSADLRDRSAAAIERGVGRVRWRGKRKAGEGRSALPALVFGGPA